LSDWGGGGSKFENTKLHLKIFIFTFYMNILGGHFEDLNIGAVIKIYCIYGLAFATLQINTLSKGISSEALPDVDGLANRITLYVERQQMPSVWPGPLLESEPR